MKTNRITSQKQIILDYLRNVTTHPSAEIIYDNVKKKLPRISRGTIYRNLESFKKLGDILEIPGEVKRFDGNVVAHNHFICENCGMIFDIFDNIKNLNIKNKNIENIGRAKNYKLYIYGKCKKCK